MGGAVALWMLLMFGQEPEKWTGVILLAPMCKIADEMMPHNAVISILVAMSGFVPTWPIVPSPNVVNKAFRDPKYLALVKQSPYYVDYPPRIQTAVELLEATILIDAKMEKITAPFLVLHGEADKVTDPKMSKELYERSPSKDKTLKLYPNVWHSIFEDPEGEQAWQDTFNWIKERL